MCWSPRLCDLFSRHGWTWTAESRIVTFTDDKHAQDRFFRYGYDSLKVLDRWRVEKWACDLYRSDTRTEGKFRRATDGTLATGLMVPPPAKIGFPDLTIQKQIWKKFDTPTAVRQAVVGAGLSVWHQAASRQKAGMTADSNANRCMCGLVDPSMPHIVFACEATETFRAKYGVTRPIDMCQERLFCTEAPLRILPHIGAETAPTVPDYVDKFVLEQLNEGILRLGSGPIPFATDGGAEDGVASWGLATMKRDCCGALPGEDDCNVTAEVFAIWLLVTALCSAAACASVAAKIDAVGSPLLVCAAVDCKPAIAVATGKSVPLDRARLAVDIRNGIRKLAALGIELSFAWVPSHFKVVKHWVPDPRFTEAELRALNDAADKAATRALNSARDVPCRVVWIAAHNRAQLWTENVFRLIADSAERYRSFLEGRWKFVDTESET
jgi:hypothetical protein